MIFIMGNIHPHVRSVVSKFDELSDDCVDLGSRGIIPSILTASGVAVILIASISSISRLSW